jgi:uncharacterized protein (TIGR03382 family)
MTIRTLTLFLLASALLHAGPSLAFLSPGNSLTGLPGETVFWNISVTNDAYFMLITELDYQTALPVGTFTDLFSGTAPMLGPGESADGSGQYVIDPAVPPGYISQGSLVVTYDLYSLDISDPGFDPDADLIVNNATLSAYAEVTVTPEPATMWMALAGAGLAALGARRRIRA